LTQLGREASEESLLEGAGRVSFTGQGFESSTVFYFVKVSQVGSGGGGVRLDRAGVDRDGRAPASRRRTDSHARRNADAGCTFRSQPQLGIYHFANCANIARIKPENRVEDSEPDYLSKEGIRGASSPYDQLTAVHIHPADELVFTRFLGHDLNGHSHAT
jgi:hypothetical protein